MSYKQTDANTVHHIRVFFLFVCVCDLAQEHFSTVWCTQYKQPSHPDCRPVGKENTTNEKKIKMKI